MSRISICIRCGAYLACSLHMHTCLAALLARPEKTEKSLCACGRRGIWKASESGDGGRPRCSVGSPAR